MDYILGLNNLNGDIIEEYDTLQSNLVSKRIFTTKFRKRSKLRKLVDKQFTEIQDWILQLSKVNLLQYGISKKVLYRTKRSIKLGHVQKLSKNTKLKFINCHAKLDKNWTLSNLLQIGHANSDNNVGRKGVINVSIKITAEELTRQYMDGKSIKQLSQETGKREWAIRKQIQRYRNKETVLRQQNEATQEPIVPIVPKPKPNPIKKFAALLTVIGFMLVTYILYKEIKKRRNNNKADSNEFNSP